MVTKDKELERVDTMVENISIVGQGAVYSKDKALYYYNAETSQSTKLAESYDYYETGYRYSNNISLTTYIKNY